MRILKKFVPTVALLAGTLAHGAPFQNLGFEEATLTTNTVFFLVPGVDETSWRLAGYGPAEELLPGWQVFRGSVQQTNVHYDLGDPFSLGFASLVTDDFRFGVFEVEGKYAVEVGGSPSHPDNVMSLVQRGEIPADAQGLRLREITYGSLGVGIEINGIVAPYVSREILGPPTYTRVTYDITPFAGQNVEMRIFSRGSIFSEITSTIFDSVEFVPIPEPSTWLLLWLGGGGLILLGCKPRGFSGPRRVRSTSRGGVAAVAQHSSLPPRRGTRSVRQWLRSPPPPLGPAPVRAEGRRRGARSLLR
jgi:hypothetical protein